MEGDEESRGEGEERIIVRPQPQSSGSETRYSAPTHICHDVYRFWDSEEACASDLDQPLSVEHPQMYGGQCKYRVRWRRHSAPKGVCVRQQCDTVIDNNRVATGEVRVVVSVSDRSSTSTPKRWIWRGIRASRKHIKRERRLRERLTDLLPLERDLPLVTPRRRHRSLQPC
jgi:hypothetical protein